MSIITTAAIPVVVPALASNMHHSIDARAGPKIVIPKSVNMSGEDQTKVIGHIKELYEPTKLVQRPSVSKYNLATVESFEGNIARVLFSGSGHKPLDMYVEC